jgi:hypothetical protein
VLFKVALLNQVLKRKSTCSAAASGNPGAMVPGAQQQQLQAGLREHHLVAHD